MPTEEQILSILRGLSPRDVTVNSDGSAKFAFGGLVVSISAQELDEYLRLRDTITQHGNTGISYAGFFEQAIEIQSKRAGAFRLFSDDDEVVLEHDQSGLRTVVGPISANLILRLADSDSTDRDIKRFVLMRRAGLRGREEVTLTEAFSRMLSVKVFVPENHALRSSSKQLRGIAEAALFHIAYGYGVGLVSIQSWERSLNFLSVKKKDGIQFPLRTYNNELVSYYQMALAGESLILSYLAFYKILEYFFTGASELLLHEKIREQLVAPDFSHTKVAKIRELARVVRKFDQKMDERRMLQTVFDQNINKEKLRSWIEEFDKETSNHLTTEHDVFGEPQRIDLSDNQLFPTVCNRIYHVRNALVHNKEGETARFIPFSGQEKLLVHEIPILKHISEELILRTGKDIQL